jgi:hypothetical protein
MDVDALYEAFCGRLAPTIRSCGYGLAKALELAPNADVPWSAVFKHEITLGAPALIAEAMPVIPPSRLEPALMAHLLSIIEAFGTDRIADGQVLATRELHEVLSAMRSARNAALCEVDGERSLEAAHTADRRTLAAIAAERDLFAADQPLSIETYIAISSAKQAVGMPASLALATAAAFGDAETKAVEAALMGSWLGLQFGDDVIDWEDDAERGGAWAILLAKHAHSAADGAAGLEPRQLVFSSGILATMLELSRQQFGLAAAAARSLGAKRLAQWASEREAEAAENCEGERRSPGYFSRLKQLAAWHAEVLG